MAISKIKYLPFLLFFLFICLTSEAQTISKKGYLFPFSYKLAFPAADLGDRYGFSSAASGGMYYKTESNWIIGGEGSFIFGNRITEPSIANSYLFNSIGQITASDGAPADVIFFLRGLEVTARIGKLIPLSKNNPNSGLHIQAGAGFLRHKIHIDPKGNALPLIEGDYAKGLDRLSNGIAFVQYIGYLHLGRRGLGNFFGGVEIIEGFTKNRRSYNFDQMRREDKTRFDLLFTIKVGFILPIYHRNKEYFYN